MNRKPTASPKYNPFDHTGDTFHYSQFSTLTSIQIHLFLILGRTIGMASSRGGFTVFFTYLQRNGHMTFRICDGLFLFFFTALSSVCVKVKTSAGRRPFGSTARWNETANGWGRRTFTRWSSASETGGRRLNPVMFVVSVWKAADERLRRCADGRGAASVIQKPKRLTRLRPILRLKNDNKTPERGIKSGFWKWRGVKITEFWRFRLHLNLFLSVFMDKTRAFVFFFSFCSHWENGKWHVEAKNLKHEPWKRSNVHYKYKGQCVLTLQVHTRGWYENM